MNDDVVKTKKPLIAIIFFVLIVIVGGAYFFVTKDSATNVVTNTVTKVNTNSYTSATACADREYGANALDNVTIECESDSNCRLIQTGSCPTCADQVLKCVPMEENVTATNSAAVSNSVVFTHDIFDVNQVSNITPLGELNGGYVEQQTLAGVMVNLKLDSNRDAEFLNIFAPTDMQLVQYAYTDFSGTGDADWTLYFDIAPGVTMVLGHVREAGEKIISATTTVPTLRDSRSNNVSSPISFAAGEYIGRTDGTSLAHNWNIYVYDASTENQFARQERYTVNEAGQRMRNATCIFDYYSAAVRQPYEALFGYSAAGQSTTCGEVARDFPGTIGGLWYFSDTPSEGIVQEQDGIYTTPLAIYTVSDDTVIIHEINGKRLDIKPNNATYKKPSNITGEYCYKLESNFDSSVAGYAYFKVVDVNSIQVAYSASGVCPSSFPVEAARTYYR